MPAPKVGPSKDPTYAIILDELHLVGVADLLKFWCAYVLWTIFSSSLFLFLCIYFLLLYFFILLGSLNHILIFEPLRLVH